jgi:ribosome recycling factor
MENIIINVPALTEERRKDLVKQAKAEAEELKIRLEMLVRNASIKRRKKDGLAEDIAKSAEDEIQKLTRYLIRK